MCHPAAILPAAGWYGWCNTWCSDLPASPGALRQARHACAYLCQSSSASRLCDRACRLHAAVQGAKLSILAAVKDPRVKAVCLLDPVDNTVYAPVRPG